ncbi:MAG: UDP-glucose/GDP-mannose dehydrogenase family protein [Bradymonadales bacterium]|nr:UDP-glucose/GDP-mannose dehydrogenase family protein [Bradymonadales bacterium]
MVICMVGTGYVGLVVGACLAGSGNQVMCVDTDAAKIEMLNQGLLPIYEPGLQEIVAHNRQADRLHFSTDVAAAVRASQLVFIGVGTPPTEDGSADLQHVVAVAHTIGQNLNGYKVIVTKSTVPVGTGDRIRQTIASYTDQPFAVVSNPEFLKEGDAVQDFLKPDRIIIGTDDPRARSIMEELYAPFQRTSDRILFVDLRSAEMTKYAANAMLATRISFMNDIAWLCEAVGADVTAVRRGLGSDPRIGSKFLFPGVGFGGSCFPKDLRALVRTGREHDRPMAILEAVIQVNERQKNLLVDKLRRHFGDSLAGLTVAVWGLAFKPGTDDLREAPAVHTIQSLNDLGVRVRAADPVATERARALFGPQVACFVDEYQALDGADALLVMTEWSAYRQPDFPRMKAIMAQAVILDGRNIYSPSKMRELGFTYYAVGRPPVVPDKP